MEQMIKSPQQRDLFNAMFRICMEKQMPVAYGIDLVCDMETMFENPKKAYLWQIRECGTFLHYSIHTKTGRERFEFTYESHPESKYFMILRGKHVGFEIVEVSRDQAQSAFYMVDQINRDNPDCPWQTD